MTLSWASWQRFGRSGLALLGLLSCFFFFLNQSRKRNIRVTRTISFLEKLFKCISKLRYFKGNQILPLLVSSCCWDLMPFVWKIWVSMLSSLQSDNRASVQSDAVTFPSLRNIEPESQCIFNKCRAELLLWTICQWNGLASESIFNQTWLSSVWSLRAKWYGRKESVSACCPLTSISVPGGDCHPPTLACTPTQTNKWVLNYNLNSVQYILFVLSVQ